MRLIDADALMREFAGFVRKSNNSDFADVPTWNDAVSLLDSAPTIEAEPLRHGEWTRAGEPPLYIIECSECRQLFFHHAGLSLSKYCSECGAKMDGGEENEID